MRNLKYIKFFVASRILQPKTRKRHYATTMFYWLLQNEIVKELRILTTFSYLLQEVTVMTLKSYIWGLC